ncbi:MAG: TonB-dependent receptor [Rhodanobacteraceae bacterium]|nr:TonB-dependent receptor [Rhodanobacteraceae bacterium]
MRAQQPRLLLLTLLIATSLRATAAGQEEHAQEHARELDAVIVEADPLKSAYGDLIQPASVLRGPQLEQRKADTLGETLSHEPGVQTSFFGPAVGRPVIRGQDGARVQVLSEGISSMDASTVSVDHATTIEPFLADQIEVLRGPATLLYGAGAVGGVVNVVDGRIAEEGAQAPFSGRAQFGVDSVADARFGMARIETGNERFVLRADAYHRDVEDYEIPGRAEVDADEDEPEGIVENSALRNHGGAVGASWIGESGFIGLAVSSYRSNYGIPGHAHEHAEERALKSEEEEEVVPLDMDQTRIDLKGGLKTGSDLAEDVRVRIGHNRYEHVELEGDEVGTRFDNDELIGRVDVVHAEVGGWRGAYGLSFSERDFEAAGEEAFVPPSDTSQLGLFLIEQRDLGDWKLELGTRYDSQEIDTRTGQSADHRGWSLSAGASVPLTGPVSLTLSADRAARLPTAEELFSDGPHAATAAYEIGDASLDEEIANQFDVGLRWRSERFTGSVNLFHTRFDDFIYQLDTGDIEDDLPVWQWTQEDARFTGFEAEGLWHLGETSVGHFDLRGYGDRVRAHVVGGGDLPRIPQSRLGGELRWHTGAWQASVGALHYFEQDRVAALESTSDSFTLWDAYLGYTFDAGSANFEWYLKGENLGDAEARLHTSVLKDRAPLPGRNLTAGVRVYF